MLQHKEERVNQIHQVHHLVAPLQLPLQAEFSAKTCQCIPKLFIREKPYNNFNAVASYKVKTWQLVLYKNKVISTYNKSESIQIFTKNGELKSWRANVFHNCSKKIRFWKMKEKVKRLLSVIIYMEKLLARKHTHSPGLRQGEQHWHFPSWKTLIDYHQRELRGS